MKLANFSILMFFSISITSQTSPQNELTYVKTVSANELEHEASTKYYPYSGLGSWNYKKETFKRVEYLSSVLFGGYFITTSENYLIINSPGFEDRSPSDTTSWMYIASPIHFYRTRFLEGRLCKCAKLDAINIDGKKRSKTDSEICFGDDEEVFLYIKMVHNRKPRGKEWATHYWALHEEFE